MTYIDDLIRKKQKEQRDLNISQNVLKAKSENNLPATSFNHEIANKLNKYYKIQNTIQKLEDINTSENIGESIDLAVCGNTLDKFDLIGIIKELLK